MNSTVRISSKRQVTIPAKIFAALNLKEGDLLSFSTNTNGSLTVTSAQAQLNALIGSFPPLPKKHKGKNIDLIIEEATADYFKEKHGKGIR